MATRRGAQLQGASFAALSKLDVLSSFDSIPVVTAYRLDGREIYDMPSPALLPACEAVTQTLKGWKCDISSAGSFSELPKEARDYVLFLEGKIGIPIRYITVGPGPDAVITR